MSYCRFGEADAYIYDDSKYGLYCMCCSLMPLIESGAVLFDGPFMINKSFIAEYDYDKMLTHVADHRATGDHIPDSVDERLIFERDCNHEFNSDEICKHCWRRKKYEHR